MNDTLRIKRVLPRFGSIFTSTRLGRFVDFSVRSTAFQLRLGGEVYRCQGDRQEMPMEILRPLPTQHFDGKEDDFIGRSRCRFRSRAPLRTTTAKPALLPVKRARGLPANVAQARGDKRDHE